MPLESCDKTPDLRPRLGKKLVNALRFNVWTYLVVKVCSVLVLYGVDPLILFL